MKSSKAQGFPPGPRYPALLQGSRFARDPIGFLSCLQQRYGDIFSVTFPRPGRVVYSGRVVFLAGPAVVKEVFTGDSGLFHAGEAGADLFASALGSDSLISLDEHKHLRRRKLLLPAFQGDSVRRYSSLIREVTERDLDTWPVGVPFAFSSHAQRVTLTLILRTIFGVGDEERIDRGSNLLGEFVRHLRLGRGRRSVRPPGPGARFDRARALVDEFANEEIAIRRADANGERHDDVLSLLLRARYNDGSPMTDEELRNELVTLLIAGFGTTSVALTWALERLLRTPRALGRLRESLAAGADDYLDATVKETLRARPPVLLTWRKLAAPATIGGFELPPGQLILAAIPALHYRGDLYPDPHEFRPERFLAGKSDTYAWIPFGGGVRRCIGAAFAQHEMRVVLRTILERTELRAADPRPERPFLAPHSVGLVPREGGRVVLERRLPSPGRSEPANAGAVGLGQAAGQGG